MYFAHPGILILHLLEDSLTSKLLLTCTPLVLFWMQLLFSFNIINTDYIWLLLLISILIFLLCLIDLIKSLLFLFLFFQLNVKTILFPNPNRFSPYTIKVSCEIPSYVYILYWTWTISWSFTFCIYVVLFCFQFLLFCLQGLWLLKKKYYDHVKRWNYFTKIWMLHNLITF
jgi:hypothetical protein